MRSIIWARWVSIQGAHQIDRLLAVRSFCHDFYALHFRQQRLHTRSDQIMVIRQYDSDWLHAPLSASVPVKPETGMRLCPCARHRYGQICCAILSYQGQIPRNPLTCTATLRASAWRLYPPSSVDTMRPSAHLAATFMICFVTHA